jgi:hypothetical protein
MKKLRIGIVLAAGLAVGSMAGLHAKLPPTPPMSDADKAAKAAKAEKDAAAKAKDAELNGKAQDKAVANYKKNKGMVETKAAAKSPASTSGKK